MNQSEFYQELVETLSRPGMEEGDITVQQLAKDAGIGQGVARKRLSELEEAGELEKHRVFGRRSWVDVWRVPKKK